jgi:hypothetical protein
MFNLKKLSVLALLIATPAIASAETIRDFKELMAYVQGALNAFVPLLFGLGTVAFMWGVIKYLLAGSPQKLNEARSYIIYSIVALTIMISIWGIVAVVKNAFFEDSYVPLSPQELNPYSYP